MDCHSPLELAAISEAEQISERAEKLVVLFVKSVFKHVSPETLEKVLSEDGLRKGSWSW